MAKIEMSVEELVKMMAGGDTAELKNVKQRMQKLLLESWLADPAFKEELEESARELAEKEVTRHIARAFSETHTNFGSPKRSFNGWAATVVKGLLDNELDKVSSARVDQLMKGATIHSLIRDACDMEMENQRKRFKTTLEDVQPYIDEQVRTLIPKYVTEDYKERVANNFDEKHVPAMLTAMVQKAIGAMLMSGALHIGTLPKGDGR